MDLIDVADEIYGLTPEEFTAARNDQAKAARAEGDKELAEEIRRLRKPSTAAWAVNMLARRHLDTLDEVAQLGSALRRAQQDREADELRALSRRRPDMLAAATDRARAEAEALGHPVRGAVASEVEQTIRAAMTDQEAATAVRSGRLVNALTATGLGPVDVSESVAVPSALPSPDAGSVKRGRAAAKKTTRAPERRQQRTGHARRGDQRARQRALQEARATAESAESKAAEATEALDGARGRTDAVTMQHEELTTELKRLRRRLREVERKTTDAEHDVRRAEREQQRAEHAAEQAVRSAEEARARADRTEQEAEAE